MSLSAKQMYPTATEPDPAYIDDKFKDSSAPGAYDGTPLDKILHNQNLALTDAIMNAAGESYNGIVDTPATSQIFGAMKNVFNGADYTNANADLHDTLAGAKSKENLKVGSAVRITDIGDSLFDVVTGETPEPYIIYQHDTLPLQLKLRRRAQINFRNIADLKSGLRPDGAVIDMTEMIGSKVFWRGYYIESDGGSNWGIVKSGAHTEDGGHIFSIDANTYIEANLKGKKLNVLKFGVDASGVLDSLPMLDAATAYVLNTDDWTRPSTLQLPDGYIRTTGQWNIGEEIYDSYQWLYDVDSIDQSEIDSHFDSAANSRNNLLRKVLIDGGKDTNIVADFTHPTNDSRPVVAYNLLSSGRHTGAVNNLRIMSSLNYVGGQFVNNLLRADGLIAFFHSRGCNVDSAFYYGMGQGGIASLQGYWTTVKDVTAKGCGWGSNFVGANSQNIFNIHSTTCDRGHKVAGASGEVVGIHTQNCIQDLWVVDCESQVFESLYLEDSSTARPVGTYALEIGDANKGASSVRHVGFKGLHIGGLGTNKKAFKENWATRITFESSRIYGNEFDLDTNSRSTTTINCDFTITTVPGYERYGIDVQGDSLRARKLFIEDDIVASAVSLTTSVNGTETTVLTNAAYYPATAYEDLLDLGVAFSNFRNIRLVNNPIVGSDERIKTNIEDIPQALCDFVMSTPIKQYNKIDPNSDRKHYGIVITKELVNSVNSIISIDDFSPLCHDIFEKDILVHGVMLGDIWQVRYTEWHSILLEAMRRKILAM